jgi:hypothetical protein
MRHRLPRKCRRRDASRCTPLRLVALFEMHGLAVHHRQCQGDCRICRWRRHNQGPSQSRHAAMHDSSSSSSSSSSSLAAGSKTWASQGHMVRFWHDYETGSKSCGASRAGTVGPASRPAAGAMLTLLRLSCSPPAAGANFLRSARDNRHCCGRAQDWGLYAIFLGRRPSSARISRCNEVSCRMPVCRQDSIVDAFAGHDMLLKEWRA